MFAIGLAIFVPACLLAFYCGAGRKVEPPEWLEYVGGGAIVLGVVLMVLSGAIKVLPIVWKAMP